MSFLREILPSALDSIAEWSSENNDWHWGILAQVWMPDGDLLSCKGLPYAVICEGDETRDLLTLFRGISARYSFSTSAESQLGFVGKTFRDQEAILCSNLDEISNRSYMRLREAKTCEIEQVVLMPLFKGTDFEPFGVLEISGAMASFQQIALHVPQILAGFGLRTSTLETLETFTGISHVITSSTLHASDFAWDEEEEEDLQSSDQRHSAFNGGLIGLFSGKRLLTAVKNLGSHSKQSVGSGRPYEQKTSTSTSLAISLCNSLLLGEEIDMTTVLELRSSLMTGHVHEPVNPLSMLNKGEMDTDVGQALCMLLQSDNLSHLDHMSGPSLAGSKSMNRLASHLSRASDASSANVRGSSWDEVTIDCALGKDLGSDSLDCDNLFGLVGNLINGESYASSPRRWSTTPTYEAHRPPLGRSNSPRAPSPPLPSPSIILKAPSEELSSLLSRVDDWTFDSFELDRVTQGRPLSCLAFYLFKNMGLIEKLRLNEGKLSKWLQRIEEGYLGNASPYHNNIHATDVLRMSHVILNRGGVLQSLEEKATADSFVPREVRLLCCYFAAIVHDYEHPGLTNDFMIRTQSKLAYVYNDSSPLENHHLAASFSLLRQEPYSFLPPSEKKLSAILRRDVIQLVKATDMKQHFSTLGDFSSLVDHEEVRLDGEGQLMALKMILKVSDLGHLANKEETHHKWISRLEQEMFAQGDKERALKLSISPLMDRTKEGVTKSQIYFFNVVAIPLFSEVVKLFPGTKELLDNLLVNFAYWTEVEKHKI